MMTLGVLLGVTSGALLAAPIADRARHAAPRSRSAGLRRRASTGDARRRCWISAASIGQRIPGSVRRVAVRFVGHRRRRRIEEQVARELPVTIDLLAVAVSAGCTPFLAVDVAAQWAPPVLAARLDAVGKACVLGRSFGEALDDLAADLPSVGPMCDALLASERLGAPVGGALLRLAAEQRTALRRRAEARARTVPVRLLFPLVFLVLPAFALLTVVPAVLGGLRGL
jgi:pilus assembly protein TadC